MQKPYLQIKCHKGADNWLFVSYAHKDADLVMPILKRLYDEGAGMISQCIGLKPTNDLVCGPKRDLFDEEDSISEPVFNSGFNHQ